MPYVYVCRAWGAQGPAAAVGLVGPTGRSSHTDPSSSHKLSAVVPIRTAAVVAPNDGDGGSREAFVTFDNRLYDTDQ